MRVLAFAAVVACFFGPAAFADDPPKPEAPAAAEATPTGIEWLHDYDAAKEQAKAEKKGVLVYLTPSWFT